MDQLVSFTDSEIVLHFNSVILIILDWFSGANNFVKLKGLALLLRVSCVLTLANKHKKSLYWIYNFYGNEIVVNKGKNKNEISLITREKITNYPNHFSLKTDVSVINHFDLENIFLSIKNP
jgi:hypothetical protein